MATRAVALDISKAFDRVWHEEHKLKSYGILVQIFGLVSSFLSKRLLQVVLHVEVFMNISSQCWSFSRLHFWSGTLPTIYLWPSWWWCLWFSDIAIYADDTTLYSKCDQAFDVWQQLELASELESNQQNTVDWGRKWLVDFSAGKTQLVSFDWSNNTGAIDVKWMGLFMRKTHLLRCWA